MPDLAGGGGRGGVIDLPPDAQAPGPPGSSRDTMAYRCPTCNIDWPAIEDPRLIGLPYEHEYVFPRDVDIGRCPLCDEVPHFADNLNPLPMEEAWSLKNHADFETYYAGRPPGPGLATAEHLAELSKPSSEPKGVSPVK